MARRTTRLTFEALEARTLMATGPIRIATLGDSLTDEYQFYAPDRTAARNWVEQLSILRGTQVDFGAFSTTSRGETRNQGYAQNWARSGGIAFAATPPNPYDPPYTLATEINASPPVTQVGLLDQPGGLSNVDAVTVLIGGNDFKNQLFLTLGDPSVGSFLSNLSIAQARVVAGVTDTVQAIRAASPTIPIVIVSTPDPGKTPVLRNLFFAALPANEAQEALNVIKAFVDSTDTQLQQIATAANARFLDANDLLSSFLANPVLDGVYIDPLTGGPEYTNFFVGDDFHPGTIGQGILANAIAAELSQAFPDRPITPMSNSEILATAAGVQPVTKATIQTSTGSVFPGQPVTFQVNVPTFPSFASATNEGTFPTPTGVVQFFDAAAGNRLLGFATFAGNTATFTTTGLSTGIHKVTAAYGGDGVYPSTVLPAQTVLVGSRRQIRLFSLLVAYENRIQQEITPPRLARWTRLLDRGYKPRAVYRAILHQAAHPRRTAVG